MLFIIYIFESELNRVQSMYNRIVCIVDHT